MRRWRRVRRVTARQDGLPGGPDSIAAQHRLGVGIGWRPEVDLTVPRLPGPTHMTASAAQTGNLPGTESVAD